MKYIFFGFLVKTIAGFDDTIVRIPIVTLVTRTKRGKLAFSIGTLLAVALAIVAAIAFSRILNLIPGTRVITSFIIFILAAMVQFDIFLRSSEEKAREQIIKKSQITKGRFAELIVVGFVISAITLVDDVVVLSTLFLGDVGSRFYAIIGIYLAAILQVLLVIYFSEKLGSIKHRKKIVAGSLVVLGMLILLGVF